MIRQGEVVSGLDSEMKATVSIVGFPEGWLS